MTASVQAPIGNKFFAQFELQPRLTNGASRFGQVIAGPALGVHITPATSLTLGYNYVILDPEQAPTTREHRLWEQAQVGLAGKAGEATLTSRTRLEQRLIEGADDMGWRFRQMLRGQLWVGHGWSVIGSGEAFFSLNDTDWGQHAGVSQLRGFAGVGKALGRHLNLEAGYLHRRNVRPGADVAIHVASIGLFYRL